MTVRELTTAQRIFKVLYKVSVPRTYLFSAHVDNVHGTLAVGNEKQDMHQDRGNVVVELPISKLTEMFDNGCTPTFAHPSTASVEIYRAIMDHLAAHNFEYERNPNVDQELFSQRIKDLVMLDEFAAWIYKIAKRYIPKEVQLADNSLAGRMAKRRSPVSRFKDGEANQMTINIPELPASHLRKTDEMAKRDFARRTGWV